MQSEFLDLPNIDPNAFEPPDPAGLRAPEPAHAPRILLLYGSFRERSFAALRPLKPPGCCKRSAPRPGYSTHGLPAAGRCPGRSSEGQGVARSVSTVGRPDMVQSRASRRNDRHHEGTDRLDSFNNRRGTADPRENPRCHAGERRLSVIQCDQSLRVLGRWMRMITIPNQSSVAKAYEQFDDAGRMRPSPYYDRIVDVMEELVKINRPGSGTAAATCSIS